MTQNKGNFYFSFINFGLTFRQFCMWEKSNANKTIEMSINVHGLWWT